jgi:hypothetical protein
MRAGPELDDDDLKRSPTAQQSAEVTHVTATSDVIDAPGTLGVLADQVGVTSGRAGPAAAGTDSNSPPQRRLAASSAGIRRRDAMFMLSKIEAGQDHVELVASSLN